MTSLPAPAPALRTREQLEALLENIARLHRERDELRRALEEELAAVRQRHRAPLAELESYLALETGWAEAWSRANRSFFAGNGSLETPHAEIGFRAEPPRLERASRRWTWSRIALTLAGLDWGKRYLRVPEPVVDQDAILADLGKLSADDLRNAGIRVITGEQFFLTPRAEPSPQATWYKTA